MGQIFFPRDVIGVTEWCELLAREVANIISEIFGELVLVGASRGRINVRIWTLSRWCACEPRKSA